ncbi:prolipoprotein diacylglyceryl transferase [Pleionea sp. CnH1-48]|uniref:prolipoprotein diacylglyceryl transferase n=1 Tax=Pleionea sp. CnH1-48 TaxID=2954494 RepID=UPI0020974EAF|nr:prolipoprotein diacylglyceryl transferase [Pleionea sp. CnH1-48]MCO7225141.1 prolipoprotein diacylglyceryl transferase [Pleionea sp. CnH1-48]
MDFPHIDPVLLPIWGPIAIRWYALTYLFGLLGAWWLGVRRARQPGSMWTEDEVSDFIFYGFAGIVLGGRFGYVLFYQFDMFLNNPLYLLKIWEGGMSFHGGLLGVLVAFYIFGRRTNKPFFLIGDFIAPLVPIGLGLGRLGNFINGELYGRPVVDESLPWAMRFRCDPVNAPWYNKVCDPEALLRHPSQIYQFLLEGVALFALLFWFSSKTRPRMAVSGLFLIGYGSFRFIVEYFREPDEHLREMAEFLSMGQVLSLPMIVVGIMLMVMAYRNPVFDVAEEKTKKSSSNKKKKSAKQS